MVSDDIKPVLLTETDTFLYARIRHNQFWELIKSGELDSVHIASRTYVTRESVDRLIERGKALAEQKRRMRATAARERQPAA